MLSSSKQQVIRATGGSSMGVQALRRQTQHAQRTMQREDQSR
jgi:hypothetical protein